MLAWIDNLTTGRPSCTAPRSTTQMMLTSAPPHADRATIDEFERKPVARATSAAGPLLAWTARNTQTDARPHQHAQWLDGDDPAGRDVTDGEEPPAAGHSRSRRSATPDAALGWVGPETNPGVWLQPLDAKRGAGRRSPIKLTERVAVSSSVDLAQRDDGGAAVYSIEIDGIPQVRFRRLDVERHAGRRRARAGRPAAARPGRIAVPIGGGYAIAYRALPGGSVDAPEIRLTFVSKEGDVMRDPAGSLLSVPDRAGHDGDRRALRSRSRSKARSWSRGSTPDSGPNNNALKVVRRRSTASDAHARAFRCSSGHAVSARTQTHGGAAMTT